MKLRPTWHRYAGWSVIVVGVYVVAANYMMDVVRATLLPGGHSPGYLLLGLLVMAAGGYFLGLFDRP